MTPAAELLRQQRARAGLSVRGLAAAAAVSPSTVSRIERGTIDPTTTTLARLLAAAGAELELVVRPAGSAVGPAASGVHLAALAGAWTSVPGRGASPDWARLRAFVDHLARDPARAAAAIAEPPPLGRSSTVNALLAGIADKVADDHGLPRPAWTSAPGRRLRRPWCAPGTPSMRRRAREAAAPQLLAHNVVVAADSLWRPSDRLRSA